MQLTSIAFWISFTGYLCLHEIMAKRPRARSASLLLASYLFYWSFSPDYLPLLITITAVTYGFGWWISASTRPNVILCVGTSLIAGVLVWYKAWEAFGASSNIASPNSSMRVLLPIGISYYTFQAISYLVDVYRATLPRAADPVSFGVYLAYFPKLIAGPIVRSKEFLTQLSKPPPPLRERLPPGILLITVGLLKKLVIADNVGGVVAGAFDQPSGLSFYLVLMIIAFYLQLYADFAGYTDIARGASRLLGIELPVNFDRPYLARSPSDFWRRWHISLSEWFRDYVYIPLGGSRVPLIRTMLNLVATMVLVGLWHGLGTMYLLWGLFWGLLLAGNHLVRFVRARNEWVRKLRSPMPVAIVSMLAVTSFGWIVFRSGSWCQRALKGYQ